MRYILNSKEMKNCDYRTSEIFQIPSLVLMERAALAVVEELKKAGLEKSKKVLIAAGMGNNGGDGLAVGRLLKLEGYDVTIVLLGEKEKATEQNRKQQEILRAYGFGWVEQIPEQNSYDFVMDALFGIGLSRNLEGMFYESIEILNKMSGKKIALDIPSGIDASNGAVLGTAVKADVTITFAFEKLGLYLWPGNEFSGKIITKQIGIDARSFLNETPQVLALEEQDLSMLPKRISHSNKGTYGKLLIVAGSINMAGAACLCAAAAMRMGCGLVKVYTPEENRIILQTKVPEVILETFKPSESETLTLEQAINWADAIVCGPGIGTDLQAEKMVRCVVKNAVVPVVLDADALNILAKNTEELQKIQARVIVTPHLGEMSRLTGKSILTLQEHLQEEAQTFAAKHNVICILKDEHTITSIPGGKTYLNLSGNSGMATAGSGDVLSGITGALLAQKLAPDAAAPLAVFLHGKAGDCAAKRAGKAAMMASDIIDGIKDVLMENEEE